MGDPMNVDSFADSTYMLSNTQELRRQAAEDGYLFLKNLIPASQTVHKALPNVKENAIRLSCDFRYQPAAQDIEEKSLMPHCQVLSWDEIYKDWERDELKHYWEKETLHLSPWDETLRWQKESICD